MTKHDHDLARHIEMRVVVIVVFGRGNPVAGKYQGRINRRVCRETERDEGLLDLQLFAFRGLLVMQRIISSEFCPDHKREVLQVRALIPTRFEPEFAEAVGDVFGSLVEFASAVATSLKLVAGEVFDRFEKFLSGDLTAGIRPNNLYADCGGRNRNCRDTTPAYSLFG